MICDWRSILLNGSLHLSSVQHGKGERSDEGVYQCVATLPSVGTMLSRSAKLQTTSLRPFEQEPKDVVVRVGDVARFNCYVHVRLNKKIYSKERKNLKKKKSICLSPASKNCQTRFQILH